MSNEQTTQFTQADVTVCDEIITFIDEVGVEAPWIATKVGTVARLRRMVEGLRRKVTSAAFDGR